MAEEPRESSLLVRFVTLLWGVMFIGSGLFKLLMLPLQEDLFRKLGLPGWALPVAGVCEMFFGVLMLSPRWRAWGALAMAVEMIGAGVAHLVTGAQGSMVIVNAALLIGAVYVLFKERSVLLPPRTPHAT